MTTMPIDLDALTMADVRAGAFDGRPVTVLGLAGAGSRWRGSSPTRARG